MGMPRTMRATDLFDLEAVAAVSAHDDVVAYTIAWPDRQTDELRSVIHLLEGSSSRQLTDGHRDAAPAFSPDGSRLAFLRSEPKGKPQAAWVTVANGEVVIVDGYQKDRVEQVDWVDDHRLLIRAASRPDELTDVDDDEIKRLPLVTRRLDYRSNDRGTTIHADRQLAIVDVASGDLQRVGLT